MSHLPNPGISDVAIHKSTLLHEHKNTLKGSFVGMVLIVCVLG